MNPQIKKLILIAGAIGAVLGLVITILQQKLGFSDEALQFWSFRLIPAVVLVFVVLRVIFQMRFQKQLQKIVREYQETGDTAQFIKKNRKLVKTVHSPTSKALLQVNISAGLCSLRDYRSAKEALLESTASSLGGINKVIYHTNLIYILFRLGENDAAIRLMNEHRNTFLRYKEDPYLGKHLSLNQIFRLVQEGYPSEAKDMLHRLIEAEQDPRFYADLIDLSKFLGFAGPNSAKNK